ncbi:MAG: L,D-transpeptidase [Actinomycetota bacterium]
MTSVPVLQRTATTSIRVVAIAVGLALVALGCAPEPDPLATGGGLLTELSDGAAAAADADGGDTGVDFVAPGSTGPADVLTAVATGAELVAYTEPDAASAVVTELSSDDGYPLYVMALSTFADYEAQDDDGWLEVLLPVRPNGSTGWIRVADVELYQNRFRIEIDISDHSLTLLERGQEVFTTEVAIGTGDTPTPVGSFFTTVLYDVPDPEGPYGPHAFALSGFSEVLTSFNGGDGLIGIHGTNDPSSLGTDVSHGCIRIPNELITRMAETVPLGTPVDITA